MVDITVGIIPPIQNNQGQLNNPRKQPHPKKKAFKEKKENAAGGRQAFRDGIVVTLSNAQLRTRNAE
ncbi:MAG: hypothetical protein C4519_21395 [Desulfobacteraceae bacterium]|nr:MAG: hypothetical protein C4519_21395 [Desulfobacteraceae bacterium]